jgi:UDP-N-acetylmuramate--alanine ligase
MYIQKVKNLHFVGIGGSGMSGIAEVLLNMGYNVSGSDLAETPVTERLSVLGAAVAVGHAAENVHGAQVVVASTAISRENPEIVAAHSEKIPVIPRAEMLAELMRMKYSVGVAGAHGKTTTTSMVEAVMASAGLDPTAVVGGRLATSGSNARLGQGEFLVAEADESDGSFLQLSPTWAIVTNIDREHLDYYSGLEAIESAFLEFSNKVPFYGSVILGIDSEPVRRILPGIRKRVLTFGFSPKADVRAAAVTHSSGSTAFTVSRNGEELGRLTLGVPGEHNVLNALAAISLGLELDVTPEKIFSALESYHNTARRFEIRTEASGIMVVDDYGHHPEEIRATLKAAREGWERRIVAVFQPHRYTRSRDLAEDFAGAFADADLVVMTGIYAAGEDPIPGVSAESILRKVESARGGGTMFVPERKELASRLLAVVREGDMVITLGAGDIWKTADELARMLEERFSR